MNTQNQQQPIEGQTGPDDIIDAAIDDTSAKKDTTQENLQAPDVEGAEPSKEETEVSADDADIKRSE